MSKIALSSKLHTLRKRLLESDLFSVHQRYKSETLRRTETPKAVAVSTPKRIALKPLISKARTNPPSRTGTPTKSARTLKSAKRTLIPLDRVLQNEQCLANIAEVTTS